jgi:hypothetical protein
MNRRNFIKKTGLTSIILGVVGYFIPTDTVNAKIITPPMTALDKINIRRAIVFFKQDVTFIAKSFIGCKNDVDTRNLFNSYVQALIDTKYKRITSIRSIEIVNDERTNSPAMVKQNIMCGHFIIQSQNSLEYVIFNFQII